MNRVFIKPAPGRRVRLEDGVIVPDQGVEVERTTYINRRIKDGDAIIVGTFDVKSNEEEEPVSKSKRGK